MPTFWRKPIRKTIYTLQIDNYAPEICALTLPLMANYARKIGANFHIIKERHFPEWPIVYEKLQIFGLGRLHANDWNLYFDADTLIHPDFFDVTEQMSKDTVAHNGKDMAGMRWHYDQYFRRDGRNLGSCNWFACASDWCLDLWHPLEDLTMQEAVANISPTVGEHNCGIVKAEHLIDDYTLSRNIARFGLKHTTLIEMCGRLGFLGPDGRPTNFFLFHLYTLTNEEKVAKMKEILKAWRLI